MDALNRIINSVAPTRVCDIGGWTDTWFAGYGNIFNIAVYPYVEVQVKCRIGPKGLTVKLENYGDIFDLDPTQIKYEQHPLIEAAIDSVKLPEDLSLEINIYSSMPPGASTGTSGAISVALIGALDALTEGRLTAAEAARLAHEVETDKLGQQSGVQDQLASAYGGINYIEICKYPYAGVSSIHVSDPVWWELESRLMLVYIGAPHNSSQVHKKVIERLGADAAENPLFHTLRRLATQARDALYLGDFTALGKVMNDNTEVQRQLHTALVCNSFEHIIDISSHFNALGCKVNGAGGDGGTITVLTDGDMAKKRILTQALQDAGYQVIPIYLARHGLRVWETSIGVKDRLS